MLHVDVQPIQFKMCRLAYKQFAYYRLEAILGFKTCSKLILDLKMYN